MSYVEGYEVHLRVPEGGEVVQLSREYKALVPVLIKSLQATSQEPISFKMCQFWGGVHQDDISRDKWNRMLIHAQ